MNFLIITRAALAVLLAFSAVQSASGRQSPDPGQVALAVARWLEQAHYTRAKVDDEMSAKLLKTYLESLDYNRLYFTQQDVEEFQAKYGANLDAAIFRGDLSPAREIFARFKQRVEDRVASNRKTSVS